MFSLKKLIATCLLAIGLANTCAAQEIITDRPDQTESSSVIPKRTMQLETGFNYGHVGWAENRQAHLLLPTALLRIGIFKNIELRVVNQFMRVQNEELQNGHYGFSDVEFGTKIQLLRKEGVNTEIALLSHVVLPIGNHELTNNQLGVVNKISISHQLSSAFSLGYNLGYNYFNPDAQLLTYSVALGIGLGQHFGFYIEPFGQYLINQAMQHNLDGGFTYLLKQNIQLDISYGIGLNYHMHYAAAGISWNFGY